MKRRTFLALGGLAGAGVMLGPWMRRATADTFGVFPSGTESVKLGDGVRAKRVLEIFLYGGLSPWETLYFVRNYGTPADPQFPNSQFYAFAGENAQALSRCGLVDAPRVIGQDANDATVELGPFAGRLFDRSDVVDRMRVVVQKLTLEPH